MNKGSCASCLDFEADKVVKSKESLKPTWLSKYDYVRNFIDNHSLNLKKPPKFNVDMKLDLGQRFSGKKILYWAASENKTNSPLIQDAKTAYHNFENSGVVKCTASGNVRLKFQCPQMYKARRSSQTQDSTFFRHLHFVVEKDGKWDSQIYTKIVICKYNYKQFTQELNGGKTVIINALPAEYFAKDHIPNSYNLFYKTIAKMSVKELHDWFGEVIKIHYPKLYTYIKNKKLEIYEIPIVVYCAHSKCNASELAIKELMKKGFVNINEYSGGIDEYRKMNPQDKCM